MQDILFCPICSHKLQNIKTYRDFRGQQPYNYRLYTERKCNGLNHTLMFFVNNTQQIDFIKISLNPYYSRFLEINYLKGQCRIAYMKESVPTYIEVPQILDLDFPHLTKLKEKIELYGKFY